ncbi:uncharacterized protein LOC143658747 isoform X3 [Tamandua tetradactyla]|uniref:uncharacterized protein LOC143658747 isoform X3 n=1 Tax=Tamandua tetradactyla TaxID=48850 RepID=UPI004053E911
MSQGPQSDHQDTQPHLLLSALSEPHTSTQDRPPITRSRRVSIQEPLPIARSHRVSIQEPLPIARSHRVSIQESPLVTHSRQVSIQDALFPFQTYHINIQNPPSITHSPLGYIKTLPLGFHSSVTNIQSFPPTTQSAHLSTQDNVAVSPSIMDNLKTNVKGVDSIIWSSQESLKDSGHNSHHIGIKPDDNIQNPKSGSSIGTSSTWSHSYGSHSYSLLPVGCRLLLEAKKISRLLGLVLSLAGLAIIGVMILGQPWIHFEVPLRPVGDPAGPQTIPITTMFFVPCPDISCLHEYDQNAYLLDFSCTFFLISSLTSLCLCIAFINTIFFNSSNSPMTDFFFFVASTLTGSGVPTGRHDLQAWVQLLPGVDWHIPLPDYWSGVGMGVGNARWEWGLSSYLNYTNFWSILALQAIWT